MLRLRTTKNKLIDLPPDARFLEVCSSDGKVAVVLAVQSDGSVTAITPGTPEAERYRVGYDIQWTGTRAVGTT